MKTIDIQLSPSSISMAINKLERMRDKLDSGTEQLVKSLTSEAGSMAQMAFGGSAAVSAMANGTEGTITASGEAVTFMEFGAGMATMGYAFENPQPVPVYPGSWSENEGSGEFAEYGFWHFGHRVYTQITPRHGMLNARDYIVDNAEEKAKEVFHL